jgi:uncharacterized protein (TIGR02646 family)
VIHVPFPEPTGPLWARWKQRADDAQRAHEPGSEPSGNIYRAVRRWLLIAYSKKCAYCERAIRGHSVRVDHFRPKVGILRLGGQSVRLRGAGSGDHPGYHFLAYDWRNLLPTCEHCNVAKSNHFHTSNEYWAERPQQLATEEPLLIHPSHRDPAGMLLFTRDGLVHPATKDDPRAVYVIDTLKLNREELREDRAEAWNDAEEEMDALLLRVRDPRRDQQERFDQVVARYQAIKAGKVEFSAVKQLAVLPGEQALRDEFEEQERRRSKVLATPVPLTPRPPPPA